MIEFVLQKCFRGLSGVNENDNNYDPNNSIDIYETKKDQITIRIIKPGKRYWSDTVSMDDIAGNKDEMPYKYIYNFMQELERMGIQADSISMKHEGYGIIVATIEENGKKDKTYKFRK